MAGKILCPRGCGERWYHRKVPVLLLLVSIIITTRRLQPHHPDDHRWLVFPLLFTDWTMTVIIIIVPVLGACIDWSYQPCECPV